MNDQGIPVATDDAQAVAAAIARMNSSSSPLFGWEPIGQVRSALPDWPVERFKAALIAANRSGLVCLEECRSPAMLRKKGLVDLVRLEGRYFAWVRPL